MPAPDGDVGGLWPGLPYVAGLVAFFGGVLLLAGSALTEMGAIVGLIGIVAGSGIVVGLTKVALHVTGKVKYSVA